MPLSDYLTVPEVAALTGLTAGEVLVAAELRHLPGDWTPRLGWRFHHLDVIHWWRAGYQTTSTAPAASGGDSGGQRSVPGGGSSASRPR